ncbi:hypothetical protein ABH912_001708 [Pseudomonas sp. BT76 TE3572]
MMTEQQKWMLEPPWCGLQGNNGCYNEQNAVITNTCTAMTRLYG